MIQQYLFDFLEAEARQRRSRFHAVDGPSAWRDGRARSGPLEVNPYRRDVWDGGWNLAPVGRSGPFLDAREGLDRVAPRRSIAVALGRLLDSPRGAGRTLLLGSSSDPYPPLELEWELTRGIWRLLAARRGLSIRLRTRSRLLSRDLDLLREAALAHEVRVEVPLASREEELLAALEPGSPTVAERLGLLEELVGRGFCAGLWLSPLAPALNDSLGGLEAVIRAGRRRGARFVGWSALVLPAFRKDAFLERLESIDPRTAGRLRRIYARSDQPPVFCKRLIATRVRELKLKYGFDEADGWRAGPAVPRHADGFGGTSALPRLGRGGGA